MINEEQITAYREMAKNASENSMEAQIRANLESTCDKFAVNEDKFNRCMAFLKKVCLEMLGGEDASEGVEDWNFKTLSGDIPDEVCFRICRDYFNDEIWKNGSVNQFYGDESARDIKVMRPGPKVQECLNSWLDKYKADVTKALKGTA